MTTDQPSSPMEERLDRLERAVEALTAEVAALRSAGARRADERPSGSATTAGAAPDRATAVGQPPVSRIVASTAAGAPRPRAGEQEQRRGRFHGLDLEALIGRYGTLLLGSLTIVLGVGAFLNWAVQRITLGPAMRVALGTVGVLLVAALGGWLRRRGGGTRRFGNVLLALALALAHVVAWAAGPGLHVVHPTIALLGAVVASLLLAVLAWREGEQALFVVGVGGAMLAPFVTAEHAGDPVLLLAYGWVVVSAAVFAVGEREWKWSRRLLMAGVLAYSSAALDVSWEFGLASGVEWAGRVVPAVFVLACVASAFMLAGRMIRSVLARLWLLVLLVPLTASAALDVGSTPLWSLVVIAGIGTVAVYLALRLRDARQTMAGASAVGQPGLLLLAALTALPTPLHVTAALVVAGWATMAAVAAWDAWGQRGWLDESVGDQPRPATGMRDPMPTVPSVTHMFVAGAFSLVALAIAFRYQRPIGAPVLVAHAVLAALLVRRVRHPLLFLTPVFGLLLAAAWAHELLDARVAYEYIPFVGVASLSALAVVVGWWWCGRLLRDSLDTTAVGSTERAFLSLLGPIAAFVWIQVELGQAFSPERAAFLLIAYHAATGVLLIGIGRSQARVGLRRVGLVLAVMAALRAIVQASDFASVGLRVGSYLLVGCFLLGVAYWYRGAGDGAERSDATGG